MKRFNWIKRITSYKDTRRLILVAGMPKSGTTAIAKLLGAACGVSVCSDPFYQLDANHILFRDAIYSNKMLLSELWKKYNKFFKGTIVKDPNFSFLLTELFDTFPSAKYVYIVRDPRDNIRSILNRLNLPGNPSDVDLDSIKHMTGWYNLLIGNSPSVEGDNYIEILSKRWLKAANDIDKYRDQGILIRYEDFNLDKKNEIYNLAKALGYTTPLNIDKLLDVQFQPKGDHNISWNDFFGEKQLSIINELTKPMIRKFNYRLN